MWRRVTRHWELWTSCSTGKLTPRSSICCPLYCSASQCELHCIFCPLVVMPGKRHLSEKIQISCLDTCMLVYRPALIACILHKLNEVELFRTLCTFWFYLLLFFSHDDRRSSNQEDLHHSDKKYAMNSPDSASLRQFHLWIFNYTSIFHHYLKRIRIP